MDPLQLRNQYLEQGLRNRYVELRFDGDRTLSGTVMRYGDTAELAGGAFRERFEPGAFGDIAAQDIVLNVMHDRHAPIARTGGGGLELVDGPDALELRAVLPNTSDANDALTKARAKILRGFSVEFRDEKFAIEGNAAKQPTFVIRSATLKNVALVDRPAYKGSSLNPRSEEGMDDDKITAIVEQALKERGATDPAMAPEIAKAVRTELRSEIDDALKQRDEERAAKEKVEAEALKQRDEAAAEVDRRVDTLVQCRSLLADDFDHKGKSVKDILVAAAGDEVKGAQERSEDYLLAKVEGILERRGKAADNLPGRQNADTSARAEGDAYGISAINRLRKVS